MKSARTRSYFVQYPRVKGWCVTRTCNSECVTTRGLVVTCRCGKKQSGKWNQPVTPCPPVIYYQTHEVTARTNVMKDYHEVQKLIDVFAWRFSRAFSNRSCAWIVLNWQLWNWALLTWSSLWEVDIYFCIWKQLWNFIAPFRGQGSYELLK